MGHSVKIEHLIIILVFEVVGILISAFTVAFNLLYWAKGRTLSTCDLILEAKGFASVCYQRTRVAQSYITLICLNIHGMNYVTYVLSQFRIWSASFGFWSTACLYVFYCVKIVDFNHNIFIWLKLRISKVVPWLLLGSVVGTLALSITSYWSSYAEYPNNATIKDTTKDIIMISAVDLKQFFLYDGIGVCITLIIGIVSMTFILISLYRHTQRMKKNVSGFSQPQLDCHYGAARMLGSLLFINILFLFSDVFSVCTQDPFLQHVFLASIEAFVTAQSVLLILGNTKLRQALLNMLTFWRK